MDKPQSNAEQDAAFVRNFAIVLLILAGIGVAIYFLAGHVYSGFREETTDDASIATRVAPVGNLNTSGEPVAVASTAAAPAASVGAVTAAAIPATSSPGEAAYNKVCFACHGAGVAGAPKLGDQATWEARVAQGTDTLYKHALEGFQGQTGMMPPKGGATDLADADVKGAVDFMLASLGGSAAAAPAAAPAPETAPAAAPAEAAPAAAPATADAGAKGKEIYDGVCFVCHGPGAAGAPKFGDAAAWGERIAQGNELLYDHSINGFMGKSGMMPPKGGRPDIADADVKAAVDYMVNASK